MNERDDMVYKLAEQIVSGQPVKYLTGSKVLEINMMDAVIHAIGLTHNKVMQSFADSVCASIETGATDYRMRADTKLAAAELISKKYDAIMAVINWGDDAEEMMARAKAVNDQIIAMHTLSEPAIHGEGGTTYLTSDQMVNNFDRLEAVTLDDTHEYFRESFEAHKGPLLFKLKRSIANRAKQEARA